MTWTSPLALAALLAAFGFFWLAFGIGTYWPSKSGGVAANRREAVELPE